MSDTGQTGRALCRRISFRALGLTALAATVSVGVGQYPVAAGLALGAAASVGNLWLMERMLRRRLGQTRARATALGFFGLLARYPVMAAPLVIGALTPSVSFGAAAVGLFAVQVTILLERFIPAGG